VELEPIASKSHHNFQFTISTKMLLPPSCKIFQIKIMPTHYQTLAWIYLVTYGILSNALTANNNQPKYITT